MGTGHVRRMAALATALRASGHDTIFVCRDLGVAAEPLLPLGADLATLPPAKAAFSPADDAPPHASWAGVSWQQDARETVDVLRDTRADWIVIDHYSFGAHWHQAVREETGARIAAIDDMADRSLDCDLLIDHNYAADHRAKYGSLLPRSARICGGSGYALLAPAYADAPRYQPREDARSIGIFIGGTDLDDMANTVVTAVEETGFEGSIELVATSASVHLGALEARALADPRLTLSRDLPDLSAFLARHDLQVGGGGGATWERCCVGAPTLGLIIADNQEPVLAPLAGLNAMEVLDLRRNSEALAPAIAKLLNDPSLRRSLAVTARTLVDGRGAARVVAAMEVS